MVLFQCIESKTKEVACFSHFADVFHQKIFIVNDKLINYAPKEFIDEKINNEDYGLAIFDSNGDECESLLNYDQVVSSFYDGVYYIFPDQFEHIPFVIYIKDGKVLNEEDLMTPVHNDIIIGRIYENDKYHPFIDPVVSSYQEFIETSNWFTEGQEVHFLNGNTIDDIDYWDEVRTFMYFEDENGKTQTTENVTLEYQMGFMSNIFNEQKTIIEGMNIFSDGEYQTLTKCYCLNGKILTEDEFNKLINNNEYTAS